MLSLHFYRKVKTAGGLHERCSFFCFDVYSEDDADYTNETDEKQYFLNLYDTLLSKTASNHQSKYSLVQILCVVKLFGYRAMVWSRNAFAFVQPRLNELRLNKPCKFIQNPNIFKTQQHMAIRRRSAEHTARYACLIQMFTNALEILKVMDESLVKTGQINLDFEMMAQNKVG